jgi:hypothetical protein
MLTVRRMCLQLQQICRRYWWSYLCMGLMLGCLPTLGDSVAVWWTRRAGGVQASTTPVPGQVWSLHGPDDSPWPGPTSPQSRVRILDVQEDWGEVWVRYVPTHPFPGALWPSYYQDRLRDFLRFYTLEPGKDT